MNISQRSDDPVKILHSTLSGFIALSSLGLAWLGFMALRSSALDTPVHAYAVLSGSPLRFAVQWTPLSGVFLILLGVVGALAALYGLGYGQHYRARHYGVMLDAGLFVFIGTMALVFSAANVFTFMMAWEVMSITSYLLVVYEHPKKGVIRAGLLYAVITQLGSVFLLVAFFLLHHYTGSYDFFTFARLGHTLPPMAQSIVFICALIGFSTKAGIMPLHVWLPEAHPVAPSHISALMSGVMIKTALFGLVLVTINWLHGSQLWWGALVTLLGVVSATQGALWSGQDGSLKRILAYSSIDNMGLIFLCTGVALMEMALRQPTLTALALTAALFHAWNHALFKSTLFEGAGAVLFAAHTGMLNRLGGLIHRMPVTSVAMLVALLSFVALPPLGGFASEWLMFSTLARVASIHLHSWIGLLSVLGILALFLTSALSLLSGLRLFGIGFLAEPRSPQAAQAHEVPFSMRASLLIGAALTLASGLGAYPIIAQIEHALPSGLSGAIGRPSMAFSQLPPHAMLSIGGVLLLSVMLAWLLPRILYGSHQRVSSAPTWTCGGARVPQMSYSATGLSQPVRRAFTWAFTPIATRYLYRPAMRFVSRTTTDFRAIQSGHVRTYLLYLLTTVLLLLLVTRMGGN